MSRLCLPLVTRKGFFCVLLLLTAAILLLTAGRLLLRFHRDIETGFSLSKDETKPVRGAKPTLNSEKLPLRYAKNSIPFTVSDQVRRTFVPPSGSYHTLTSDKMADFVFVTAASSNHFAETVDAISSIQTIMPEKKIMYFDIGLKAKQIAETALREQSAVFWIDASFRIKGKNLSDAYRVARKNGGYVMFIKAHHSNFAVTHPDMYRYLPTDVNSQKKIQQFCGCMMLIYWTEKVFRDILWWFVLCALEERCFRPNSIKKCTFAAHDAYTKYAKCHRYEQSAINLIPSNIWMRDKSMVYKTNDKFFKVVRHVTHTYSTKTCNGSNILEGGFYSKG